MAPHCLAPPRLSADHSSLAPCSPRRPLPRLTQEGCHRLAVLGHVHLQHEGRVRLEPQERRLLGPQLHQLLEDPAVLLCRSGGGEQAQPPGGGTLPRQCACREGDPLAPPPYLFASGVEALLHPPPGLGHVALLHQGKVVGVLEADLQPAVLRLLQGGQEILGETPWRGEEGALLGGLSAAQRLQAGPETAQSQALARLRDSWRGPAFSHQAR